MRDLESVIADVESRWQTATPEERRELIDRLRAAEGATADLDDVTRTRVAALVHRIEASLHSSDKDYVTPPINQGSGFGFGQTLPGRFDTPDR